MKLLVLVTALVACGGDEPAAVVTDAAGSAALDAPLGALALTSATLAGSMFPDANTCTGPGDTSPVLTWTGDAKGALSFAISLTDPDANNLIHWAIYDIPAGATSLPAAVQTSYMPANVTGAHQSESFTSGIYGYRGPCPPQLHTYRFDLFALDVATLPGTSMATTRNQIATLVTTHTLAKASLTASYQKP
ncbi:hypothetical protein BH11MYX1_BH11MYX1_33970 [soil metagenome]